jgi:hypothetical protein
MPPSIANAKKKALHLVESFFKALMNEYHALLQTQQPRAEVCQNVWAELETVLHKLVRLEPRGRSLASMVNTHREIVLFSQPARALTIVSVDKREPVRFSIAGEEPLPEYATVLFDHHRRDIYLVAGCQYEPKERVYQPFKTPIRINVPCSPALQEARRESPTALHPTHENRRSPGPGSHLPVRGSAGGQPHSDQHYRMF